VAQLLLGPGSEVGLAIRVGVGLAMSVGVGLSIGVGVKLSIGVGVGLSIGVGVGVVVGFGVRLGREKAGVLGARNARTSTTTMNKYIYLDLIFPSHSCL